jgi:ribosomal protein S18 acetylase RimI-like enzyme
MPHELLEVGVADEVLWATAVGMFRGVAHSQHHEFLADPATVAFLARSGDEVVGWAWGYRQLRADGNRMLLLYEIEVAEEHRRRGVGRSLLDGFLGVARREGHRKMWLITGEDNDPAKALYESTGGERSAKDDLGYWWQFG